MRHVGHVGDPLAQSPPIRRLPGVAGLCEERVADLRHRDRGTGVEPTRAAEANALWGAPASPVLVRGGGARPLGRTLRGWATFLVIRTQNGPEWDPAKPMEEQTLWPEHAEYRTRWLERGFFLFGGPGLFPRVPFAVSAGSEEEVRAELARDPWHESHLVVVSVEPWVDPPPESSPRRPAGSCSWLPAPSGDSPPARSGIGAGRHGPSLCQASDTTTATTTVSAGMSVTDESWIAQRS